MDHGTRRAGWTAVLVTALAVGGCGIGTGDPVAVLERARVAMDGGSALAALGTVEVHASGTLDKAAEGQAFAPGEPAPGPLGERLAVDPAGDGVVREYDEIRFDGTRERFGELYPADTLQTLLLRDLGLAVPFHGPGLRADRLRLRRRLPHLLVAELLASPGSLELRRASRDTAVVAGRLGDGTEVALDLDRETGLPLRVRTTRVLPGRGPVELAWSWDDWREVAAGVRFPHTLRARVGDRPYTRLEVDSVRTGRAEALDVPADLRRLAPRPAPTGAEADAPLEIEALHPAVWRVPEVRSGFAPLVAESDSFLVVVDAPASFPLLGGIPPGETDPGPSFSHASERLLDALEARWPEKPVRFLVLTHHHEDHVGGVRAFVAAGATVVGSSASLEVARRLVALPPAAVDDRLATGPDVPFRTEVLEEPRLLGNGPGALEVVPVGENPHARGMAVVRIPAAEALWVSDLATPAPLERYPAESHAPLDLFFSGWLDARGLEPDAVWSMHASTPLTSAHLARLDSLRAAAGGR